MTSLYNRYVYMRMEICLQKGSSYADIVFCQRIIAPVVEKKQMQITKNDIDMSRAFDLIMRNTIIKHLKVCGCREDEIWIVKMLLKDPNLRVQINKTLSVPFEVTIRSFQGNSLSAKLFTLYLAGAPYHLRRVTD